MHVCHALLRIPTSMFSNTPLVRARVMLALGRVDCQPHAWTQSQRSGGCCTLQSSVQKHGKVLALALVPLKEMHYSWKAFKVKSAEWACTYPVDIISNI